jgi:hypothetical protein
LIRRIISLGIATRFVNVSIWEIFRELRSSLLGAMVMVPVVVAVYYLAADLNPFLQLTLIVLSGGISYLLALWGIERENLVRLLRLVKIPSASV